MINNRILGGKNWNLSDKKYGIIWKLLLPGKIGKKIRGSGFEK